MKDQASGQVYTVGTSVLVLSPGGLLLVLVIEASQPESPGLTSRELGELLLHYDARDAINLDGGNCTALAVRNPTNGKVVAIYRGAQRILPFYHAIYPGS